MGGKYGKQHARFALFGEDKQGIYYTAAKNQVNDTAACRILTEDNTPLQTKPRKHIMFMKYLQLLSSIAFWVALTPPALAAPESANPNKEVMICILNECDIEYTEADGKIVFGVDDDLIVIDSDTALQNFTITAFKRLGIAEEKRPEAYKIVNRLNVEYNTQFCIDDDGDLKVQVTFDTDNMTISKNAAAAALGRVVSGLEIGAAALACPDI